MWEVLRIRSARTPDRQFLIWHPFDGVGRAWTFRQFAREAAGIAAGLQRRGVKAGDRVLIHLENCPEFVLSWFACAAIGAVAVTTNTRSAGDELRYYTEDSAVVGAITQPRFAELVSRSATGLRWQVGLDHDAGRPADGPSGDDAFASLRGDPDDLELVAPDPMAPMSVQYTSGTTARPKGVVWTHANGLWACRVNAAHEGLRPDDCHLAYAPLFHTNALAYSMLPSLWTGSRFVLVPKWSTSRFWDVSLRYGCSWLSLIGPAGKALYACEDPPAGHSYRLFGAGVCELEIDERYRAKTIGWWGMTETISHGIVGDPYMPDHTWTAGRPAPEYGVAVVREDGVTPVEFDETGHLLIKGTPGLSLFAGYLDNPEATAASFDEWGWFRTGDLVTPLPDGYIAFAERAKDMLRVGGENVAALEVERVVMSVPGVAEVAVVARPDERLDEVPVAFVVAPGTGSDLPERVMAACADLLADFKVPRDVRIVRELPRSMLQKVNKAELRRWTEPGIDLTDAEAGWIRDAEADPSGALD